jgi:hypothetical protein
MNEDSELELVRDTIHPRKVVGHTFCDLTLFHLHLLGKLLLQVPQYLDLMPASLPCLHLLHSTQKDKSQT